MLPLPELKTRLRDCESEVFWKPAHPQSVLALPLFDEGVSGGVEVVAHKQRRKYQAIVVAVNECRWVDVGDLVSFDMGRAEELYTVAGESFYCISERQLSAVDEEFSRQPEPKEQQLASGLWVATQ